MVRSLRMFPPIVVGLLWLTPAAAQVLVFTPSQPSVGETITVAYNETAPGASIRNADAMRMDVMIMREGESPLLKEVPLTKGSAGWSGAFVLEDSTARLIIFRPTAGSLSDNNGGKPWATTIYDASKRPLKNSHLMMGQFLSGSGMPGFKHDADFPAARAEMETEKKFHPDNYQADLDGWRLLVREKPGDETLARVAGELDRYMDTYRGNELAVAGALSWFDQTGQKGRGDSIRAAFVASNPKGRVAETVRRMEWSQERNPAKRAALIAKFKDDFPQSGQVASTLDGLLVRSYLQSGDTAKAVATLEGMVAPDYSVYNMVAWGMIDKGTNLEQGVEIARRGAELALASGDAMKPSYMSAAEWDESNAWGRAAMLDTYAYGLFKQGQMKESVRLFGEAYSLTKGQEADIVERYVAALAAAGDNEQVLKVARESVVAGKASGIVIEEFRSSYGKVRGSDAGFDEALGEARKAGEAMAREKLLKGRIDKPGIDFTLTDLEGKAVRLSDQQGKVVVLDFWATWCGPCKSSFPTLQEVFEKYRSNDRVAIFALNTWERVGGRQREELVKKFMAENKYTFPVLFDEGFVDRYGVEGIPTKFIIDKKGRIAFKSIGFNGADEMMRELTMQLDLLVAE